MKINYADYIKKTDASVLVAEAIFSELYKKYPLKRISEVAHTTSGGTPLRGNSDFHNGTIPWLKSGELKDGWIEEAEEFITEKGLLNSSAKIHPEGTLLLAMYGATAGRTGITKIKASTNQAVCALFPNEKISRDFLFWFLRQHRYKFIEISKGGAQPNISQSVIKETKLPVPEPDLQVQISNLLFSLEKEGRLDISLVPEAFRAKVNSVFSVKNNVFEIDTELTHQLSLVQKLRQQLLQEAVQGKLVPQDPSDEPAGILLQKIKAEKERLVKEKKIKKDKDLPEIKAEEIPFEIPEGWVWCRLGEIALFSEAGKSLKADEYSAAPNEWGVIKTSAITSGQLIEESNKRFVNKKNEYHDILIKEGDLLFCRASGSKELAGVSCLVKNRPSAKLILSDKTIRYHFNDSVNKNYIQIYNSTQFSKRYYQSLITGKSTSMNNITREQFNNLSIPLPPLAEQHRIVQKLEQLLQVCDNLHASIQESLRYNEQLLQQVLREALKGA